MMIDFSFISVEYLKSTKLALLTSIDIISNAAVSKCCFCLEFCMSEIYLLQCMLITMSLTLWERT